MIVCITGMPGSGKSVVADMFKGKGYAVYEIGDVVRKEMKKKGIRTTPEEMKKFSVYFMKKHRNNLVKFLLRDPAVMKNRRIAIVGFRSMEALNYVKKRSDTVTIAVVAPTTTRVSRAKVRHSQNPGKVWDDVRKDRDDKEIKFGILRVIESADYVISNTGTIADLKKSVAAVAKDAGLF
jgi:dephospho-CoA kinase